MYANVRKLRGAALAVLGLLILLLGASCSGGSNLDGLGRQELVRPPAPSASPAGLPAVASLPQGSARAVSYVETDLQRLGKEYEAGLASQHVVTQAPFNWLHLSADLGAQGGGISGAAYALFHFNAPDYDRDGKVELESLFLDPNGFEAPADYELVWVGLANWELQRWDWYPLQSAQVASFYGGRRCWIDTPGLAPYFNAGDDLYVAVLSQAYDLRLNRVYLGVPPPHANFKAQNTGNQKLEMNLDATLSFSEYSEIVKYEFDPENDGSFIDNGVEPVLVHDYGAVGDFTAALRVTDALGHTESKSINLTVNDYWQHSLGVKDLLQEVEAIQPLDDDSLVALGSVNGNNGPDADYPVVFVRLQHSAAAADPLAGVQIVHSYLRSSIYSQFKVTSCCRDSLGNIIVGGTAQVDDGAGGLKYEGFLQSWTPNGEVNWDKRLSFFKVLKVVCDGTAIYGLGFLGTAADNILFKTDLSGNLLACQYRDHDSVYVDAQDIALITGLGNATLGVAMLHSGDGYSWITEWNPDLQFVKGRISPDPVFNGAQRLYYAQAFAGPGHYLIAGTTTENIPAAYVQNLDKNSNIAVTRSFYPIDTVNRVDTICSLLPVNGGYVVGGTLGFSASGTQYSFLTTFDGNMDMLGSSSLTLTRGDSERSSSRALVRFRDGLLLAGEWGYTDDPSGWEKPDMSWKEEIDIQWQDYDGLGGAYDPQPQAASGQVTDSSALLILDPAVISGGRSGMLSYVPVPPALAEP